MEIKCFASSSAGNAYAIVPSNQKGHALIIECGLPYGEMLKRLFENGIPITNVCGCLITHSHGDHSKSAKDFSRNTMIYASKETLDACGIAIHRYTMNQWETVKIADYSVIAFNVEHDCAGAYGFIIEEIATGERMLFINDTKMVKWDFSEYRFDHVMIECNHDDEIISLKDERTRRVANSHMSLRTTALTLERMNLTDTKDIYLMHMSSGNSDEQKALELIARQTGLPVYSCQKNGGMREHGRA
jgi:phosphoribosyl 1,2-cyclic phosphodiesterase